MPAQADAVEELLHRASAGEIVLVINYLVVAEVVWTLESYYHQTRESVKDKVLAVLNTPGVEVAEVDLILQAISWYVDRNVDFADALNAAWLLDRGLTVAYTFDRQRFSRLEGIDARVPGG